MHVCCVIDIITYAAFPINWLATIATDPSYFKFCSTCPAACLVIASHVVSPQVAAYLLTCVRPIANSKIIPLLGSWSNVYLSFWAIGNVSRTFLLQDLHLSIWNLTSSTDAHQKQSLQMTKLACRATLLNSISYWFDTTYLAHQLIYSISIALAEQRSCNICIFTKIVLWCRPAF